MRLRGVVLVLVLVSACQSSGAPAGKASPAQSANPASAERIATPAPSSGKFATTLNCEGNVVPTHGLALFALPTVQVIDVLDVSNPLQPRLLCTLGPARGGRFVSATKIAFWIDDKLGSADLASGLVAPTAHLPAIAWTGSFSRDGSQFAYRSGNDTEGGMSTHLYSAEGDRILYSQDPLGGHGGPPWGPISQLIFSPDGSELLDYYVFRPTTGPDNFLVFRKDGSVLFHSKTAVIGAWSADGSLAYYFVFGQQGFGELDAVDSSGQTQTVVSSMNGFFWPTVSPDGSAILYTVFDKNGLPGVWRVILPHPGGADEVSTALTSRAVYVTPNVIWVDEEKQCECGPGGSSMADGVILAHDFAGPWNGVVDMTQTVPGIGAPNLPPPTTENLIDAWF